MAAHSGPIVTGREMTNTVGGKLLKARYKEMFSVEMMVINGRRRLTLLLLLLLLPRRKLAALTDSMS